VQNRQRFFRPRPNFLRTIAVKTLNLRSWVNEKKLT
jgi:hypothetical protein